LLLSEVSLSYQEEGYMLLPIVSFSKSTGYLINFGTKRITSELHTKSERRISVFSLYDEGEGLVTFREQFPVAVCPDHFAGGSQRRSRFDK
jgi:hypothetical protein